MITQHPQVIGFYQGFPGVLVDLVGIGKNIRVHPFCSLEVKELEEKDEAIIIELS